MRIAIIADSFPPLKNSAAVLVLSLAEALAEMGHELLVIVPTSDVKKSDINDDYVNFKVLRINCGEIKTHHKFMRGIIELSLFFTLPREFKKTPYAFSHWDAVIWYSPSIFLSGLVRHLKKRSKYSYLILRDIMPDWLVDIGLIKKRSLYYLLKWFERYQYKLADVIGVQSLGNKHYIEKQRLPDLKKLEVLPNWMPSISTKYDLLTNKFSDVDLQKTILFNKKVFIYAGNLGEAQGVENFAELIFSMRDSGDVGFLIIGRGSKKDWLQDFIKINLIQNTLILDEVNLTTLSMYYRQCYAGLVFLNLGHQSHNIPGKFVSYLEASLPVVACVNSNNDLIQTIKQNKLGLVVDNLSQFSIDLEQFVITLDEDVSFRERARNFYENHYLPSAIALQILAAFPKVSV